MNDFDKCPYCGIRTESPCDEPPPDTCEKALEATYVGDPHAPANLPIMYHDFSSLESRIYGLIDEARFQAKYARFEAIYQGRDFSMYHPELNLHPHQRRVFSELSSRRGKSIAHGLAMLGAELKGYRVYYAPNWVPTEITQVFSDESAKLEEAFRKLGTVTGRAVDQMGSLSDAIRRFQGIKVDVPDPNFGKVGHERSDFMVQKKRSSAQWKNEHNRGRKRGR